MRGHLEGVLLSILQVILGGGGGENWKIYDG